jgi:hypothetical protein
MLRKFLITRKAYLCILDTLQNGFRDETCQSKTSNCLNEGNSASTETESSKNLADEYRQYVDIYDTIKSELETLQTKFPQQFQTPIFVLPSVNLNMKDQWKERLIQAKHNENGQRIVLIPCYVGNLL